MTISFIELADSQSGVFDRAGDKQRVFNVYDPDAVLSREDIQGAFEQEIGFGLFDDYVYDGASYNYTQEGQGREAILTVFYRQGGIPVTSPPAPGTSRFRFTTGSEVRKVTYPLEVLERQVNPNWRNGTVIEYEGIGDDGKTLQGVEVPTPVFSFAYDFTLTGLIATAEYIQTCRELVTTINDDFWNGFDPGLVRLDSVTGDYEIGGESTLTFEFSAGVDETNIQIGDVVIPEKGAWDYLDIHTYSYNDQKVVRTVVTQVDRLRVYRRGNFSLLQIPT